MEQRRRRRLEAERREERRTIPDSEMEFRICIAAAQLDGDRARRWYEGELEWWEVVRIYAHQTALAQ